MADTDGPGPTPGFPPDSIQVWLDDVNFMLYSQDDFNSMYVDDNIVNFSIQPDWALVNIDDQTLTLTYQSGVEYSLKLGSIATVGTSAEKWFQPQSQLVIPADASLAPMFSVRTTPNLWNLRLGLNNLVQQLNDQRIQIASIVYSFAKIIDAGANNDMSGIINDLKSQSGS
jgi:hypothetical protein